jgi:hypothetical protein
LRALKSLGKNWVSYGEMKIFPFKLMLISIAVYRSVLDSSGRSRRPEVTLSPQSRRSDEQTPIIYCYMNMQNLYRQSYCIWLIWFL